MTGTWLPGKVSSQWGPGKSWRPDISLDPTGPKVTLCACATCLTAWLYMEAILALPQKQNKYQVTCSFDTASAAPG